MTAELVELLLFHQQPISIVKRQYRDRDADRRGDHRTARDNDPGPFKPLPFLMFLFAIGYGVGPQFVRGIAKDGIPQALFAVVHVRVLSCRSLCRCQDGWLRRRLGGRPLCRLADHIGIDGSGDRRDQPPRPAGRPDQEAAGRHAGRLRGDLHFRHGWLGDRARPDRSGAARHRSRSGLQAIRREARRQEGARRRRHGLAPVRAARIPRSAGRSGRGQDGA